MADMLHLTGERLKHRVVLVTVDTCCTGRKNVWHRCRHRVGIVVGIVMAMIALCKAMILKDQAVAAAAADLAAAAAAVAAPAPKAPAPVQTRKERMHYATTVAMNAVSAVSSEVQPAQRKKLRTAMNSISRLQDLIADM